MHRSCAHPDCTVTFDACRIHHVTPWQTGGPTDIDQLIALCNVHHALIHHGGWTLHLRTNGTVTVHLAPNHPGVDVALRPIAPHPRAHPRIGPAFA